MLRLNSTLILHCGAPTFKDGEISWVGVWVTVSSPSDISGLRKPTNVKLGTKVSNSTKNFF